RRNPQDSPEEVCNGKFLPMHAQHSCERARNHPNSCDEARNENSHRSVPPEQSFAARNRMRAYMQNFAVAREKAPSTIVADEESDVVAESSRTNADEDDVRQIETVLGIRKETRKQQHRFARNR